MNNHDKYIMNQLMEDLKEYFSKILPIKDRNETWWLLWFIFITNIIMANINVHVSWNIAKCRKRDSKHNLKLRTDQYCSFNGTYATF